MIAGPPALARDGRQAAGAQRAGVLRRSTPARSLLTEAGTKRRASLHVVDGRAALHALDPGGIDVLAATLATRSRARLAAENHTLKRALTDPRLFSGIGNAYSDEILHRARLSPVALTRTLDAEAIDAAARGDARDAADEWIERLRAAKPATGRRR